MFKRLAGWLSGRRRNGAEERKAELGFLVFQHTGEVIQAERGLQAAGFRVEVKGPPPELRTGCDMVLTFPLMKEHAVRRVLEELHLTPLNVVPVSATMLEPVSLFRVTDYGQWIMVQESLDRNKTKGYRKPRSNEALLTGYPIYIATKEVQRRIMLGNFVPFRNRMLFIL